MLEMKRSRSKEEADGQQQSHPSCRRSKEEADGQQHSDPCQAKPVASDFDAELAYYDGVSESASGDDAGDGPEAADADLAKETEDDSDFEVSTEELRSYLAQLGDPFAPATRLKTEDGDDDYSNFDYLHQKPKYGARAVMGGASLGKASPQRLIETAGRMPP